PSWWTNHWTNSTPFVPLRPDVTFQSFTPLAEQVVAYLETEGFHVADWRALGVEDNEQVGRIPAERVMEAARDLDLDGVDALVISACVQMPSLDLVQPAEEEFGIPVVSAATAGAYTLLKELGLTVDIPSAGSLLRADRPATH
ncbi:aspartate racemase/maleate isomerase family protein, partial [Streptomyces sp. NPDC002454]